jgi:hypothetical protein
MKDRRRTEEPNREVERPRGLRGGIVGGRKPVE